MLTSGTRPLVSPSTTTGWSELKTAAVRSPPRRQLAKFSGHADRWAAEKKRVPKGQKGKTPLSSDELENEAATPYKM